MIQHGYRGDNSEKLYMEPHEYYDLQQFGCVSIDQSIEINQFVKE